jgi:hypothetical protein
MGELPNFLWVFPSDVDDYKAQNDPDFKATDAAVSTCGDKLAPAQRDAWRTFYAAWRSFADEKTPIFGAANKWVDAHERVERLGGWQKQINAAGCTRVAPDVVPPSQKPPPSTTTETTVKVVAVAVAVAAVAYAAARVLR